MLHSVLQLQTDEGGKARVVVTKQRSFRRVLVISRAMCIFESVPCKGVAWHETRSFALLQAQRLAPHLNSGASAAVKGGTLMLWFWDESEVQTAMQLAGHPYAGIQRVAETLTLGLPARQGQWKVRCAMGADSMTLVEGAVVASHWTSEVTGAIAPTREMGRPWARDLIGRPIALGSGSSKLDSGRSLQRDTTVLGAAAAVACAAYLAYWQASYLGARDRLATLESSSESSLERARKALEMRRLAAEDSAWVAAYQELGGSFRTELFLQSLARPLAAGGLVVKEMEVRNEEARLVLVSASGEIDLPRTLELLGRMPGAFDVALRDASDFRQATFTLKIPGYRRIGAAQPRQE